MAMGFEKMEKGSLGIKYTDRTTPMDKHFKLMVEQRGFAKAPGAPQMFGNAGLEHMERYGTTRRAVREDRLEEPQALGEQPVLAVPGRVHARADPGGAEVYGPLTKLQCCPTSDGGGAAVLASEDFVRKHKLEAKAVEILGMAMATDLPSTFDEKSMIKLVGFDLTRKAARKVYEQSGLGPENVDVVELHDCFSCNELITYEGLGLCPVGKGGEFVDSGANTYGGKVVVNPSGGLISKGHPLGATGLAQCAELNWQLRGEARQAPGRGREGRAAAQPRPRRRGGGGDVPQGAACLIGERAKRLIPS